jgi:hypothetical protein
MPVPTMSQTRPTASRRRDRRGFALPMVIIVVTVVTVILAAGFAATGNEAGATLAQRGQTRAYALAQAGLQTYFARRDSLVKGCTTCMTNPDTNTTGAVSEKLNVVITDAAGKRIGYAEVTAQRVRGKVGTAAPIFFISSRGIDSTTFLGGFFAKKPAERTVGMYAQWNTTTIQVVASWLSLTGLEKQGVSGDISGVDDCGKDGTLAGVVVPKGDFKLTGNEDKTPIYGNPPVDTSKTAAQLIASTKINWDQVQNKDAIPADVDYPTQPFPTAAQFAADTTWYPVIHVRSASFSLPNEGRGMLIVDGNLTISGDNMWSGVILVGGKLVSNGGNVVRGATLSGLDALLPGYVPPAPGTSTLVAEDDNATANGTKKYLYNSCSVSAATAGMKKFMPLTNVWVDNVPGSP